MLQDPQALFRMHDDALVSCSGGKKDDITVLVGVVEEASDEYAIAKVSCAPPFNCSLQTIMVNCRKMTHVLPLGTSSLT